MTRSIEPVKVGLIGCGVISAAYLKAAATFDILDVVACADLDPAAAARTEREFAVPARSVDALLAQDDIEVVLNLTIPAAHAKVNAAAIDAGKHAYCEKPFALDASDGAAVLRKAKQAGKLVGCAPDTFLGGGYQTVRELLDTNAIGRPVAGTAFMMNHGHEHWHPNPSFYYQAGGGPLFDMGPYYLTALVFLLGPVRRVAAMTGRAFDERTISSEPQRGTTITVGVDTHATASLEFDNGALVTVVMSFDIWRHNNRFIEVHGTDGSIAAPDPNTFGGDIALAGSDREWRAQTIERSYTDNMRSIGLADMCEAIRHERQQRCSGALAQHVLEVMEAVGRSSTEGRHVDIETRVARPEPLPRSAANGRLE